MHQTNRRNHNAWRQSPVGWDKPGDDGVAMAGMFRGLHDLTPPPLRNAACRFRGSLFAILPLRVYAGSERFVRRDAVRT